MMLTDHMQRYAHFFNRDVGIYESPLTPWILFHERAMKNNVDHVSHRETFLDRVLHGMGTNCIVSVLHL